MQYCSQKCQKSDWKIHKKDCQRLREASEGGGRIPETDAAVQGARSGPRQASFVAGGVRFTCDNLNDASDIRHALNLPSDVKPANTGR